jgi:hypothetical protein
MLGILFDLAAARSLMSADEESVLSILFQPSNKNVLWQFLEFCLILDNRDVGHVAFTRAQNSAFVLIFENLLKPAFRKQGEDEWRQATR